MSKAFFPQIAGGILIVLGVLLIVTTWPGAPFGAAPAAQSPAATATLLPTPTREPIVPTTTPSPPPTVMPHPSATSRPSATPRPSVTPTPTLRPTRRPATPPPGGSVTPPATSLPPTATQLGSPTPTPTAIPPTATAVPAATGFRVPAADRHRMGVSIPLGASTAYDLQALGVGWVMDWRARTPPALPSGVAYAQTVRMIGGVLRPDAATLTAIAAGHRGATWLISNEPDVRWQDNVLPEVYARLYHEAYTAIKAGDPTARVAAGGIAQPTPLRLRYLDLVLAAYREQFGAELPAQAWQIHNYMLHEERDSWGVDIPPGIADNTGILYGIDDSGNLTAFRSQIYDFRRWMAGHGYSGMPLIVAEFGVPMPPDYGFPPERMGAFLAETWSFLLTAADSSLGDPADGGRLVQQWCWFSIAAADYPSGDLIDETTGAWTPLGKAWLSYVAN